MNEGLHIFILHWIPNLGRMNVDPDEEHSVAVGVRGRHAELGCGVGQTLGHGMGEGCKWSGSFRGNFECLNFNQQKSEWNQGREETEATKVMF